ncbi:invasin domain 3-containing protein [Bartonella choladocola]|uniref:invasin domain 3-containing protein n=1 Tax=Bartonella choladocola TaxID=2750995 RepID=UPI00098F3BC5|nr:invasin domain 3-containing protein [Bartonella choladocola]
MKSFNIRSQPTSIIADNEDASTLTFTAKDKYGNQIGGLTSNLNLLRSTVKTVHND